MTSLPILLADLARVKAVFQQRTIEAMLRAQDNPLTLCARARIVEKEEKGDQDEH